MNHTLPGLARGLLLICLIIVFITSPGCAVVTSRAYELAGIYAAARDEKETAISHFTRAIEADPSFTTAYINRSRTAIEAEDFTTAIADLSTIITRTGDATAYRDRGWLYYRQRRWKEAIADLNVSVRLQPSSATGHYYLAEAYRMNQQYTEAFTHVTIALDINPRAAEPHATRGTLYVIRGEYEKAVADLDFAITHAPSAWRYWERSKAYLGLGHKDKAQADFTMFEALMTDKATVEDRRRQFDELGR